MALVPKVSNWSRTVPGQDVKYFQMAPAGFDTSGLPAGWQPVALGSAGIQVSPFSPFKTQAGFNDWKTKYDASAVAHGRNPTPFQWQSKDIDGDDVPEALVWSGEPGNSPIVAVNGMKVKPSHWQADTTRWYNPYTKTPDQNYYEWQHDKKQEWRAANAKQSSALEQIRSEFRKRVKAVREYYFPPGTAARKVPASRLTALVINDLGGKDIDQSMIAANQDRIRSLGLNMSQALAQLHKTDAYRQALINVLKPIVDGVDAKRESTYRTLYDSMIRVLGTLGVEIPEKKGASS
jgi:hypothetical protein